MNYSLGNIAAHIHWVLSKPALPGWEDIRQTVTGHTFYYIHSGRGIFRNEDEVREVEEGMVVYLWPGLPLHMRSSHDQPIRMTMLLFDCVSLQLADHGWLGPDPIGRLKLPFILPLKGERMRKISMLFEEAEREWVPGDHLREARVKAIWSQLVLELHEAAEAGREEEDVPNLTLALQTFKERLETGFTSNIRIEELAREIGFSPAYVRRAYRARYGCSPKEYLDQLRNEHALRRLRFTGDTVTEIAKTCGYQDVYQFSKAFKKHNGMSPTEYRMAHSAKYTTKFK